MKRDMDLIREILLQVEEAPADGHGVSLKLPEYDPKVVNYHVRLLAEADLIKARTTDHTTYTSYRPLRLTWTGHEFLDAARNERLWSKVKDLLKCKVGPVPLEVLQTVLTELGKQAALDAVKQGLR